MTIDDLTKLWHALNIVFSKKEAKTLFVKLLRNLKEIIL